MVWFGHELLIPLGFGQQRETVLKWMLPCYASWRECVIDGMDRD